MVAACTDQPGELANRAGWSGAAGGHDRQVRGAVRWGSEVELHTDTRAVLNLLELQVYMSAVVAGLSEGQVTQDELDVLFKRFAVPGPEVDYHDFLAHCSTLGDITMKQSATCFSQD